MKKKNLFLKILLVSCLLGGIANVSALESTDNTPTGKMDDYTNSKNGVASQVYTFSIGDDGKYALGTGSELTDMTWQQWLNINKGGFNNSGYYVVTTDDTKNVDNSTQAYYVKYETNYPSFCTDNDEYNIKYNTDIVYTGGEVTTPNPTCAGYTFTGWYEKKVETIPTTTSYVGKYADLNGDGTPEGIIFADLAERKSGTWGNNTSYGAYSYSAVSNLKDYYVSQESYEGKFGTAKVISPISGSTGNDRFYIMALDNFTTSSHSTWYWYSSASGNISDYSTITSDDFGTGKQNTATMISKWNSSAYGSQNARDIWGAIQTKVADGWFVPSRAEWSAFAANLEITKSNYGSKGLSGYYWSSSLYDSYDAYTANFGDGHMNFDNFVNAVRLAKTF